jgi:predicted PurR-regulated permease PerM
VYLSIRFVGAILGIIILFSLVALIVLVLTPGVIGIFLAVPTLAVIKTLIEEFYLLPKEAGKEHDVSEKVEQIVSGQPDEENP